MLKPLAAPLTSRTLRARKKRAASNLVDALLAPVEHKFLVRDVTTTPELDGETRRTSSRQRTKSSNVDGTLHPTPGSSSAASGAKKRLKSLPARKTAPVNGSSKARKEIDRNTGKESPPSTVQGSHAELSVSPVPYALNADYQTTQSATTDAFKANQGVGRELSEVLSPRALASELTDVLPTPSRSMRTIQLVDRSPERDKEGPASKAESGASGKYPPPGVGARRKRRRRRSSTACPCWEEATHPA